jgi:hypothetical protein
MPKKRIPYYVIAGFRTEENDYLYWKKEGGWGGVEEATIYFSIHSCLRSPLPTGATEIVEFSPNGVKSFPIFEAEKNSEKSY